jgi:hypothetical protein
MPKNAIWTNLRCKNCTALPLEVGARPSHVDHGGSVLNCYQFELARLIVLNLKICSPPFVRKKKQTKKQLKHYKSKNEELFKPMPNLHLLRRKKRMTVRDEKIL